MNTNQSTHTVRIECACSLCKANSAKVGKPFPLAAMARPEAVKMLSIDPSTVSRSKKSGTHGLVHAANDPSLRGYNGPMPAVAIA